MEVDPLYLSSTPIGEFSNILPHDARYELAMIHDPGSIVAIIRHSWMGRLAPSADWGALAPR
jgi:hypothetical protein